MKITVIGPQFPDSFARNVTFTLEKMGHQVFAIEGRKTRHNQGRYVSAFYRLAPKAFPSLETRLHAEVLEQVATQRPACVLITYDFFSPQMVQKIKLAAKAPVLCWYIDAPANLRAGNLFLCDYDAFFLKEPQLVETMTRKLGLPAHYLPEACNPHWHKPVTPTKEQLAEYGCDVASQGTLHPYRAKFFESLLEFDVRIWGSVAAANLESPSRKFFQNKFVAEDEKAFAFNSAKVFVNAMHFVEARGVNNTLFETAGCGVLQLCDERPTLSEFFETGREIVTFASRDELLEKIRYYLSHEAERAQIGRAASARAHAEHTYEKRLTAMLRIAKLA
jgi:spore maturation protein CgeB